MAIETFIMGRSGGVTVEVDVDVQGQRQVPGEDEGVTEPFGDVVALRVNGAARAEVDLVMEWDAGGAEKQRFPITKRNEVVSVNQTWVGVRKPPFPDVRFELRVRH